jgi:uncharacterized Zn finger protein (UPF0148 family)
MSDFDKEAEREKLREKFARDEEERAGTARMSELLLKGATMTNKHHDCGAPVFRWKGEEFCPTCHGGPGGAPEAGAGAAPAAEETGGGGGDGAVTGTEDDEAATAADGVEVDVEAGEVDAAETAEGTEAEPSVGRGSAGQRESPPARPTPTREPTPRRSHDVGAGTDDTVTDARTSLERTLAAVAERAETTEEISRKREYLAAAREAAEALAAVREAER